MENQEINPIPTPPATPPTPGATAQDVYPSSIMYMVFGIISVCVCWFGVIPFVGPLFAIVALVFGVLAFTKGKKMQKDYDANVAAYKPASKAFIKVASITGLVGIILSAIYVVVSIFVTIAVFLDGSYF